MKPDVGSHDRAFDSQHALLVASIMLLIKMLNPEEWPGDVHTSSTIDAARIVYP